MSTLSKTKGGGGEEEDRGGCGVLKAFSPERIWGDSTLVSGMGCWILGLGERGATRGLLRGGRGGRAAGLRISVRLRLAEVEEEIGGENSTGGEDIFLLPIVFGLWQGAGEEAAEGAKD